MAAILDWSLEKRFKGLSLPTNNRKIYSLKACVRIKDLRKKLGSSFAKNAKILYAIHRIPVIAQQNLFNSKETSRILDIARRMWTNETKNVKEICRRKTQQFRHGEEVVLNQPGGSALAIPGVGSTRKASADKEQSGNQDPLLPETLSEPSNADDTVKTQVEFLVALMETPMPAEDTAMSFESRLTLFDITWSSIKKQLKSEEDEGGVFKTWFRDVFHDSGETLFFVTEASYLYLGFRTGAEEMPSLMHWAQLGWEYVKEKERQFYERRTAELRLGGIEAMTDLLQGDMGLRTPEVLGPEEETLLDKETLLEKSED